MAAILTTDHPSTRRLDHRAARRAGGRPALALVAEPGVEREPAPVAAIVAGCLALFLVLGAFVIVSGRGGLADVHRPAAATASPGAPEVTVAAGDTVWSIARRLQPTGDVRPLVEEIVALNGGADLRPGQHLVLPG